jgi:hypothetical protein
MMGAVSGIDGIIRFVVEWYLMTFGMLFPQA